MSCLPSGWAYTQLREVLSSWRAGYWGAQEELPGRLAVRVVRNGDIRQSAIADYASRSFTVKEAENARILDSDVILCSSGHVGKVALGKSGFFASNFVRVLRPVPGVSASYLFYWLQGDASRSALRSNTGGSTIQNLRVASWVEKACIPIAPHAERKRIVAAIEEAFSKLDAGEAGLRTVYQLLKRMRAAVLAAAVTGRLVPQDPTDAPTNRLLADLGVMAEASNGGLPPGWAGCRLGVLTVCQQYGLSLKAHAERTEGDVPMLRMGNLRDGRVDPSVLKFVRRDDEGVESRMLRDGDLLFNRTNSVELVGKSAVYRGKPQDATFASYLIRVQTADGVEPEWCASVINSHLGRAYIESVAVQQVGQANVNGTKLKQVPVPLPPHEEQLRILAELERQASFLDACERAVDAGLARSAALRRSVLRVAFEGKLVPQDPTDEPASQLLDRIRSEQAAAPKAARRTRRNA